MTLIAAIPSVSKLELSSPQETLELVGAQNENLKLLERRLGIRIGQRGTELLLSGTPQAVSQARRLLTLMLKRIHAGQSVFPDDVEQAVNVLKHSPDELEEFAVTPVATRNGRSITPRSLTQKKYVQTIQKKDIVFGIGPAGTGKTYLAMAMAVSELHAGRIKKIILARPAVEAGEKLGFLPGDLAEKVNPYLRPLYDALHDMMDAHKVAEWIDQGVVEVAPLAFMRGRTLNDAFAILDEAQNSTVEQMKMFLTRLGYNSKAVITGDVTQVDLPSGKLSGLVHARRLLSSVDGIGFVEFSDIDVVRHPLVQEVIRAYDADTGSS